MNIVFSSLGLLLAALVVTAAILLGFPSDSNFHQRLQRDQSVILASLPDPDGREALRVRAQGAAEAIHPRLVRVLGLRRLDARPAVAAGVVRVSAAAATLPIAIHLAFLGVTAGLLRRRLLIERTGFHSLTFSYLGKVLAASSAAAYGFTSLSPLAPPLWTLYVFALAQAGGAALFFGNLPPKL